MVSNRTLGAFLHNRRPEIIPSNRAGEKVLLDLLIHLNAYKDEEIIRLVRRQ